MQMNRVGLTYFKPTACYLGYTLFCGAVSGGIANLIDMNGRICHRWENERGIRYAVLLPNGNILCRAAPVEGLEGQRGLNGLGSAVFELDWDGNLVWEYKNSWVHHDSERMPNGNTLIIQWEKVPEGLTKKITGGYHSDDDPEQMLGDVIVEVTPDGSIIRKWLSWDHLKPDEDIICPLEHRTEWSHCNSVSLTPDGDWLVSFRRIDTLVIVDRKTGEFKWKWGRGILSHQHHATYLDNGNILVFDNGPHRRGPAYSQVLEINPENDEIVWEYKGNPILSFFSFMVGGAERLPNGNTLICEGAKGRVIEVTTEKELVWEYINPFFTRNPRFGDGVNFLFRAHRYGPEYPALQGRDLDPGRYSSFNNLYSS